MKPLFTLLLACTLLFTVPTGAHAQGMNGPELGALEAAKGIVADSIFARLEAGEADALAEWITDQLHSEASGTSRLQQLSNFQSQFRMIAQGGPKTPFGQMEGFDMIQKTALPGTDRYFRLVYLTYHESIPLVWEFHFYVRSGGDVKLSYFKFDGKNPFEYLSTPDMFIENYYE